MERSRASSVVVPFKAPRPIPLLAVGALLATLGALAGCGQKGALTLPAPERAASAPAR